MILPVAAWAEASSAAGPDEIIVTAQRRAQCLEDVPMSITAITPQAAELHGVRNQQDLGQSVAEHSFPKQAHLRALRSRRLRLVQHSVAQTTYHAWDMLGAG